MRSSTSSEPTAEPTAGPFTGRPRPAALTTPLVRCADGVWLKLEALQPSGHLTDRLVPELVASHRAAATGPVELVLARLDRLALSIARHCVSLGHGVTVFYRADAMDELRLRQLVTVAGARLERVRGDEDARHSAIAAHLAAHPAARLVSTTGALTPQAGQRLAAELVEQLGGRLPHAVVLPPDAAPLAGALAQALAGCTVEIVEPGDPEIAELRETQRRIGRGGILIGPDGAAVCARAEALAAAVDEARGDERVVIGVLPDGGQRHLGWWGGWGQPRAVDGRAVPRTAEEPRRPAARPAASAPRELAVTT